MKIKKNLSLAKKQQSRPVYHVTILIVILKGFLMTQVRQFRMHPDLLFSVIKSQAGTQEKALLEAVMNAVDAGATECYVDIDEQGYLIKDNGKGFASKKEIEDFFETFGTPHHEGDATYGKFRMGRGQLFAFSTTVWTSNTFKMDVCIKSRGLDYQLDENEPFYQGCQIKGTWHEKIKSSEILNIAREFKNLVKYMQIPVIFNGENISCLAEKQKWTLETDEAYFKITKEGKLSVYNLGSLVAHYPGYKFGISGTVVSKKQLTVNFARNDILVSQCRVWKKIAQKLNELMGVETKKKIALTDDERTAIVEQLLGGQLHLSQVLSKGLFKDVTSKTPTLKSLLNIQRLSFSSGNYHKKIVEEQIHTQELAFILEAEMLDRLNVSTPEEFVRKINELIELNNNTLNDYYHQRQWQVAKELGISHISGKFSPKIISIETLVENFNSSFEFKNEKKLTAKEKCIINALNQISPMISRLIDDYNFRKEKHMSWADLKKETVRKICIGISSVANAWTDGLSYIAIDTKMIKAPNAMELVCLCLHEYCHNCATSETHSHGIDFYEMFHNIMLYQAQSISYIVENFDKDLLKEYTKAKISSIPLENKVENQEKKNKILDDLSLNVIEGKKS